MITPPPCLTNKNNLIQSSDSKNYILHQDILVLHLSKSVSMHNLLRNIVIHFWGLATTMKQPWAIFQTSSLQNPDRVGWHKPEGLWCKKCLDMALSIYSICTCQCVGLFSKNTLNKINKRILYLKQTLEIIIVLYSVLQLIIRNKSH